MKQILYYTLKVNAKDASFGEFFPFLTLPILLFFLRQHEITPLLSMILIGRYCNQFNGLIPYRFIVLTGIDLSAVLQISNMIIIFVSSFLFLLSLGIVGLINWNFSWCNTVIMFLVLNFYLAISGNLFTFVNHFFLIDFWIKFLIKLIVLLIAFLLWFVMNQFELIIVYLISTMTILLLQLLLIKIYDKHQRHNQIV